MCNDNRDCQCISNILKVICILQRKACCHEEECLDTCDRQMLGYCSHCECYNTRPIQLFLCCNNGNDPLVMPTTKGPITPTTVFSNVFRVEKVDECCATFRVLETAPENEDVDFIATDSFFTLDLHCCCAVKCLDDTFVECV